MENKNYITNEEFPVMLRGDIFYVQDFKDTVGCEQQAGRPMLVVSNDTGNGCAPFCIMVSLTLQDKPKLPTHAYIAEGKCSGSTVLCEQIRSVSKTRVGDFMCHLSEKEMLEVNKCLAVALDLIIADTSLTESEKDSQILLLKKALDEVNEEIKSLRVENSKLRDMNNKLKAEVFELTQRVNNNSLEEKYERLKEAYIDLFNKSFE